MLAHFARLGWQHINLTGDQGQHALELPRRSGRVVKVDLFRLGDPCPRRDVGSQASSRAKR